MAPGRSAPEAACCNPASLHRCLLALFAASKPRNQAKSAKPSHQIREAPAIFLAHGRELQSQTTTGLYTPHNGFGPDLSFFDKEMKVGLCAQRLWLPCLHKQTARA